MIHAITRSGWLAAALLCAVAVRGQAMNRWVALAQIESGSNDRAVGPRGEISRYQIRRTLWRRYAPPRAQWTNPQISLAVAKFIMRKRCRAFEKQFHRPPDNFEFYVLWNAPGEVTRPSRVVRERARRFANLVSAARPGGNTARRNQPLAAPPRYSRSSALLREGWRRG